MSTAIVWFRQDLRLTDHPALHHAAREHDDVILLYILDDSTPWPMGRAQRWWLHHSLIALQKQLKKSQLILTLKYGNAHHILSSLCKTHKVTSVYWNRCYEPFIIERDTKIKKNLKNSGVDVHTYNGNLLHEPWEILNKQGTHFKVFTPFLKKSFLMPIEYTIYPKPLIKQQTLIDSDVLDSWKLLPTKPNWASDFDTLWTPGELGSQQQLDHFIENDLQEYSRNRDIPAINATSKLSPHLHFGEISPKQIWHAIKSITIQKPHLENSAEHFLREIGWREFSYYLLYHFPQLPEKNFKKEFDHFAWSNDQSRLLAWQKGETGFPIVDAGMRELWHTGYMHNRVRMIAASFLTKDLLIDWRHGAAWFWDTLLDADLANNSMSWQWVAGCGADAAPYFRIFNPMIQTKKFDPENAYIRQWIPDRKNYPDPIMDHDKARKIALAHYKMLPFEHDYKNNES